MKKVIIALFFLCGTAAAEDITVSGINLKDLVANTRVGVFLPFAGGSTFKTLYTPVLSLHSAAGTEYLTLDVGAAAPTSIGQGYLFASLGFRLDNILVKSATATQWSKTHIAAVSLPTLEAGAGALLYANKLIPGANIALRF